MTSVALSEQRRALLEKLLRKEGLRPGNGDEIRSNDHFGPVPLSFAQQRLWFLQQLQPNSYLYNIPLGLRIEGPLNVAALEHSINQIICRHESLRTTFKVANGQAFQIVNAPFKLQLSPDAVQITDRSSQQKEIARRAGEELRRTFDLTVGPLVRAKLLRFAANDHVLLLTMHHIVADGWSIGVFLRELGILYDSYLQGKQPDLPPLIIQYADFAIWQRQEKHIVAVAAEISYWKHQLDGIPAMLQLPADHPRPQRATFHGEHIPFLIPKGLEERLKKLGRSENATLFITLLAAFNVLLYRYSGQEDIAIGTPVAQRNRPEIEDLIGVFVNTLVLRAQLSGVFTFRELLRKVREVSLAAFAHQDAPFEKLVEELHPERNLGHSPLFQVMLDLQTAPLELPQIRDLRLNLLSIDTQTAKFDLALTLSPTGEGLNAALECSTDIFEKATARRIVANFVTLLQAIVEQPETKISHLPLLAGAERELLQEWNHTEFKFEGAALIHRMFEQQAQRKPAEISVTCGDRTLRYEQLNRQSNQLARHLLQLGVGPKTLVGTCLERSAEMPLAVLAVLKAGGAYVPLDPSYPLERLAFMIEDAHIKAVVTNSTLLSRFTEMHVQTICLDALSDAMAAESEENHQASPMLDNTAYVIYTSGSTGNPKGVIVSHRNLIHSTLSRIAYYHEPVRAFLLLPSFSFDSSIAGLFWTLSQGGKLVVPEEGSHQDPAALVQLIEHHSVSHLLCLPTMYRLLLEQKGHGLNSLRTVIVAGEQCPVDLIAVHCERLPQASLFNEYGPTEATVWSTVFDCRSTARVFTVPIGRPIVNTRVYVLDRHSQPVPVGATGELYIGGDGISRGYLNRPELTAERFIPDSFSRTPGARLYKTGDLGRHLYDGNLEFKGRNDFQVKVRGYRIEPSEIELALAQHPSVLQTTVVADDKALKAFVRLRREASTNPAELRFYLKSKLPDYMVPGSFIFLDLFPLTPTGKIDRKALFQMKSPDSRHIQEYVAPQTALEQVLAAIFADVLGSDRVGLLDNFFEMGGHSLMATQVASRVHEALCVDLPLRRIFEMPSVGLLANTILNEGPDPFRVQRTAELLLRLSHVSDEEAEALLEKSLNTAGKGSLT